jgi:hypothetical protein
LEYAIRHEGVDLNLLRELFPKLDPSALVSEVEERPTSKYLRKIWFLYEQISGQRLLLPDLNQGNYVDLLDPKHYYTGSRTRFSRQRINVNLIGDLKFCGIVRKRPSLDAKLASDLVGQCQAVISKYPPELFERAMNYLYRKETKSSFEIENAKPDQARSSKFVAMLKMAGKVARIRSEFLIELQNLIVEPRFANRDFRNETGEQIYVGQAIGLGRDLVHFVGPKPEDTKELMQDWIEAANLVLRDHEIHPIVAAAVVAFGFVFIHPFSDGNGRIHRFLIHHVLAQRGFAPESVVFPVSAVMLKRMRAYDAALESFSTPLMERVAYEQDAFGNMTVSGVTDHFYRAIDYTEIVEVLFDFVFETIETELPGEFEFLGSYDDARTAMARIVDLPDRMTDLFIRLIIQNQGHLSKEKRTGHGFEKLTDKEIRDLETAVSRAFKINPEL